MLTGGALDPAACPTTTTLAEHDARASTRSAPTHDADAAGAGRARPRARRFRRASASRRRSSTSSTSSARTAPTTRSSATWRGQRRPEPLALRRGRDAERPRARARVRAVRQLLRGRRGELRRPRLLDRRPTPPTSSRRSGRRTTAAAAARYLSEGGGEIRNAYGNLTAPPTATSGTSRSARRGVGAQLRRVRVVADEAGGAGRRPRCPVSRARCTRAYPPYDLDDPRQPARRRVARGVPPVREGGRAAAAQHHPARQRPHRRHARPAGPTPRAMVAENDLALGRLVEAISKSRFWKESAIFVLEDDAQNGPDHVDAHRSVLLVGEPVREARRRRQHALHDLRRAAHDRAHPRAAADEPVRRGRDADVQRLPGDARPRPPYALRPARVPLDEMNRRGRAGRRRPRCA